MAASSGQLNQRTRWTGDRDPRYRTGCRRTGRRVHSIARLPARLGIATIERRSWATGRVSGISTHGRPWVYAREARELVVGDSSVTIDGVQFTSTRCGTPCSRPAPTGRFSLPSSAGPELEEEAQTRWRDGKPDEYFFLEVYGSAVVEHLVTMAGARLCAWADGEGAAVLPHYSPGYPEWSIDEQATSARSDRAGRAPACCRFEVLQSGMLQPKKSLLAVFGLTRHTDRVRRLTDLSPCENCSFIGCQYRRSPYRRARRATTPELPPRRESSRRTSIRSSRHATYSVSLKALQRWSRERLTIATSGRRQVDAVFRYEGTTCTNMGRPLKFHYHVTLGPREDGYPIREQSCGPAPGDEGYTSMCRYIRDREALMASIERERPLHGQPLDDVVRWIAAVEPGWLLLRGRQPTAQVGPCARDDFTTRWHSRPRDRDRSKRDRNRSVREKTTAGRDSLNGRSSATARWALS